MRHFLVVYNRPEGRIVRRHMYRSAVEALAARFTAEREFENEPEIEIVVLGGESWQAVELTHSRYFKRVQDLAKVGLDRLSIATS